jgi:hypothetical protein
MMHVDKLAKIGDRIEKKVRRETEQVVAKSLHTNAIFHGKLRENPPVRILVETIAAVTEDIAWVFDGRQREPSFFIVALLLRHLVNNREKYVGKVWCVRVPTGAFFARRNGKIFVTGNSGFPKSTSISKGIDRKLGKEREVVGYKPGVGGENLNDIVRGTEVRQTTDEGGKGVGAYGTGAKQVQVQVPVTKAASEEAQRFEGYGTALKPAHEIIITARKP